MLSANVKLTKFSVALLWCAALFDPHGYVLNLRFVALNLAIILIVWNFVISGKSISCNKNFLNQFCFFVLFLPTYGLVVGLLRGGVTGGDFIDTSYIASSIIYFCCLLYFFVDSVDDVLDEVVRVIRIFSLFIILIYVFWSFDLYGEFVWYWVNNEVAVLGVRDYAGVELPYIYFFASPMLFILLSNDLFLLYERLTVRRVFYFLISIISVFLSGTRASILGAVLAIFLSLIWFFFAKKSARSIFIVAAFFSAVLSVFNYHIIEAMFDSGEYSNAVKIGYIQIYYDIFSNYLTLLFGQGFNAQTWSAEFRGILAGTASKTELTYFEFVRVFGIMVFLLFLYFLLSLVVRLRSIQVRYQWLGFAVLMNLIISITNPYLFSTNGILLISLASVVAWRRG